MPHWRHVLTIALTLLGLLSLSLAVDQARHPITAIIQTTGQVIDLIPDPSSLPASPRYQPVIRYQMANGDLHTFTADFSQTAPAIPEPSVPPSYRVHIGDTVAITYYPWAPRDAQFGKIGRIIIFASGLQQMVLLGSGICGVLFLVGGGYLFFKSRRIRTIPPG